MQNFFKYGRMTRLYYLVICDIFYNCCKIKKVLANFLTKHIEMKSDYSVQSISPPVTNKHTLINNNHKIVIHNGKLIL